MISTTEESKSLIKQFKVETKEKNKTLSIYYGDILKDQSDIVGISVYDNEQNKGDLYNAFRKNIQDTVEYKEERTFLKEEKIWTSLSASKKYARTFLFIHSSALEGEIISQEDLRLTLKMAFATLNSFIYEGNQATSISLPILFRKGIEKDKYARYIQTFIYEASECLRKNNFVEELKIYIWHKEEAEFWMEIINGRLTVSLEENIGNEQKIEIRNDILTSLKKPAFKNLLPPWLIRKIEKELKGATKNVFPLVSEANKVIDFITTDLIKILELELSPDSARMNPYQRIFAIKSSRLLVEWFGDYIYSIKVFKKYIGHQPPSSLDNYHFLLQFAQVLFYYEQIKTAGGGSKYDSQ